MLLVDTNVWVDAADQDRPHHQACIALLRDRRTDLVTVPMVIAEAGWFIERRLGPAREVTFLRLVTSPRVKIIDLDPVDWARVVELVDTYQTLGLGTVDASIIAVAEPPSRQSWPGRPSGRRSVGVMTTVVGGSVSIALAGREGAAPDVLLTSSMAAG